MIPPKVLTHSRPRSAAAALAAAACSLIAPGTAHAATAANRPSVHAAALAAHPEGAQIYQKLCADCHGARGEGVADEYEDRLEGDWPLAKLTREIEKTMPDDDPKACVGEDAGRVAAFVFDAFYSPAARERARPARIEMARLTGRQYLYTVADLVATFGGQPEPVKPGGLSADYYNDRNMRRDKRVIERVDPRVSFDYGEGSPDAEKISPEGFSVRWDGSVIAGDTGDYTFCLKTENGARLWVNDTQEPLVDAWVASGGEVREHRRTLRLLGGRAYPLRLDIFKFKDKTSSVELRWQPPHGVEEVIPTRHLSPRRAPPTFVAQTAFPPDDASVGYPRGTAVSRAWAEAVTRAAMEVTDHVLSRLDDFSESRPGDNDRAKKLAAFAGRFVERAFRRPLTPAEREFYLDRLFARDCKPEQAAKEAVVLALTSPRFLYPEAARAGAELDDHAVAARLALGLWDSLPDARLLDAAARGLLEKREQVVEQARRMLEDPRAHAKLRDGFHHWLQMDEAEDIAKDTDLFPGFDERLVADLRTSLDRFLDEVLWADPGGADFRDLLLADYLFVNDRLAAFYGLGEPGDKPGDDADGAFRRVSFKPGERAGVVTHPYLLSTLAYRKATSPIHRGVFVTRNLLGRTLKPPPEAVEFNESHFEPGLTMREKVTELTKPAACQSCHSVINPLGFSLEHFDAVGRFRTEDGEKPVDAAGVLHDDEAGEVRLTGGRDLAEFAARSASAQRAFIIQFFNQVAKQPVQAYGPGALDRLHHDFRESGFNIRELVVEMATTAALHRAEVDGVTEAAAAR